MLVKLKTETETIEKIQEILNAEPDAELKIKNAVIEAINNLHNKLFKKEVTLLIVNDVNHEIVPKKDYEQYLIDLTGKKGPYKVTKSYKSWLGISEGVYAIEGCEKLIPVSWCKNESKSCLSKANILLLISSILQSAIILALLL